MIMLSSPLVVIGTMLIGLLVLALFLVVRPALARQRLRIAGEQIRDEVVDAHLDGRLTANGAELDAFLYYCHLVEAHTDEMRLGRALSLKLAAHKHGLQTAPDEPSTDPILRDAEQRLDVFVGDCLIHSSRGWWFLALARAGWRCFSALTKLNTPHAASAYQLAVALREEVGDDGVEAFAYRTLFHESGHREDRELVPA